MSLFQNYPLVAALCSILFAQVVKFPIAYFLKKNKDTKFSIVTSTGGMPSSHSAAVSSLITALVYQYGFASPYVAIATTFGVIVMFDAMGVRRQSGDQGILLKYLHEQERDLGIKPIDIPIEEEDDEPEILDQHQRLVINKYLGHKPIEVFAGVITGILVAFFLRGLFPR